MDFPFIHKNYELYLFTQIILVFIQFLITVNLSLYCYQSSFEVFFIIRFEYYKQVFNFMKVKHIKNLKILYYIFWILL